MLFNLDELIRKDLIKATSAPPSANMKQLIHASGRNISFREFWKARLSAQFGEKYRGIKLYKFPEDLRTYQRIIDKTKPEIIIELGSFHGGSALWFYDQLKTLVGNAVSVVTVDINPFESKLPDEIVVITGDATSSDIVKKISDYAKGKRTMLVEDSAHNFSVTQSILKSYSHLVTKGCYFVVEDGVNDEPDLRFWSNSDGGIQKAIAEFISTPAGSRFKQEWIAPYGVTANCGGWLKAIK